MSKLPTIIVASLILVLSSGCASTVTEPFKKATMSQPKPAKFAEEDERRLTVDYLARYLMAKTIREQFERKVREEEVVVTWGSADSGVAAAMMGDIVSGQISSAAGETLGASVFVATSVLGVIFNGSSDVVSGAYIPATYEGLAVETPEQAVEVLNGLIERQMEAVSTAIGWKAVCYDGCDTSNQFWQFRQDDRGVMPDEYQYKPEQMVFQISYSEIIKVPGDDAVSALLQEPIAWQTQYLNGFLTAIFESSEYDEDGFAVTRLEGGKEFISFGYDLSKVRIGRDVLRAFHSTPYTFSGTKKFPPRVFYNGDAYRFINNVDRIYPLTGGAQ